LDNNGNLDDEQRFKLANIAAEQLWREQQLTSSRMGWNLQFQGFLFAAFIFSFGSSVPRQFGTDIRLVIAISGSIISGATFFSVRASQLQRDFMKKIWMDLYPTPGLSSYPRPFAQKGISKAGRYAPNFILFTIIGVWVSFVFFIFLAK